MQEGKGGRREKQVQPLARANMAAVTEDRPFCAEAASGVAPLVPSFELMSTLWPTRRRITARWPRALAM